MSKNYYQSICKGMNLEIEDDVLDYVLSFQENSTEVQHALWKLKSYSILMHMDITIEVAKELLHQEAIKNFILSSKNHLLSIANISVKYLFNDDQLGYGGDYYTYDLVYNSIEYKNKKTMIFNVKDINDTKEYKIKLKKKKDAFYISSKYFDHNKTFYKVNTYFNSEDIFIKGKFDIGEIHLHITFV